MLFIFICNAVIDCGAPPNASGVTFDPFNDTKFGALIIFRCENTTTALCGSDGEWSTSPSSLKCGETCSGHGRSIDIFYCYYDKLNLVFSAF